MPSDGPDESRRTFAGSLIGVTVERWGDSEREIVERADSVAVVALDEDDRVVLVRQFRAAARRPLVELPAGTIDDGEEPLAAAKRELAEEVGVRAETWTQGPSVFASPGYTRERVHLFLAEGLEPADAEPDADESIEVERWPLASVSDRLGEVEDAKTLAGLLLALRERATR